MVRLEAFDFLHDFRLAARGHVLRHAGELFLERGDFGMKLPDDLILLRWRLRGGLLASGRIQDTGGILARIDARMGEDFRDGRFGVCLEALRKVDVVLKRGLNCGSLAFGELLIGLERFPSGLIFTQAGFQFAECAADFGLDRFGRRCPRRLGVGRKPPWSVGGRGCRCCRGLGSLEGRLGVYGLLYGLGGVYRVFRSEPALIVTRRAFRLVDRLGSLAQAIANRQPLGLIRHRWLHGRRGLLRRTGRFWGGDFRDGRFGDRFWRGGSRQVFHGILRLRDC
jgi:hypothetical protein